MDLTPAHINDKMDDWITAVIRSVRDGSIVKVSLGNYQGATENLKKILARPIEQKGQLKWKLVYRYKTKDITKLLDDDLAVPILKQYLIDGFKIATLFTTAYDYIFENIHNKKIVLRKTAPQHQEISSRSHDDAKKRLIASSAPYLRFLGISDKHGKVYKAAQHKYKQINHFISILEPELRKLPKNKAIYAADMGSGKGYLTFALFDYLNHKLNLDVTMTGIDVRTDMVQTCMQVVNSCGFDKLHFAVGQIGQYTPEQLDLLVALHACDTATDEAIFIGIQAVAQMIVVAPCCHKEIRKEMDTSQVQHDLKHLTRHGLFMERQAEMVTDSIRMLVLEYFGYKIKVLEFISDEHTPKNVMLVATRSNDAPIREPIVDRIKSAMAYFGIRRHSLVELCELV